MPAAVQLLILVAVMLMLWTLLMRPARNQQRAMRETQRSIEVGDEVVISAGIFGTVRSVDETSVALEIAPDEAMSAVAEVVTNFRMPGHGMPGFERSAAQIAIGNVYNLRIHHDDVLQPVLRHLKVMETTGLGAAGQEAQERLGAFLDGLDAQARKFDERQAAMLARKAAAAARK